MEIWKPLNTETVFDELYEVSNTGLVRRVKPSPHKPNEPMPRILKPGNNGKGYLFVNLSSTEGKKQYYVHRLVLTSFVPLEEYNDITVNHKDGNRANNSLSNLEWLSYSDNNKHSYRVLERPSPKLYNSRSKRVQQLDLEGNVVAEYPSVREAQRQVGLHLAIDKVCNGHPKRKTAGGYKWRYI